MDMALRAHRLLGCKGASRSDFRWDDEPGRGGRLSARGQHPAGHDPAEPGARTGAAEGHRATASWSSGSSPRRWPSRQTGRSKREDRVSAAHVRRGVGPRASPGKAQSRGRCRRRSRRRLPVEPGAGQPARGAGRSAFRAGHRRRSRWSRSISRPRSAMAAGEAVGDAGFRVKSVDVAGHQADGPRAGLRHCARPEDDRRCRWSTSARSASGCSTIGWVKDARVSRRFPDTLVIDIVERKPAALWQNDRAAVADRRGRRGARPRSGQPDARPAAADRPGRQRAGRRRCSSCSTRCRR